MRKILLTSAGFETTVISSAFLRLVGKDAGNIKALFIPTAANNAAAIEVLPECMNDLLKIGIPPANITVFDLHRSLIDTEMSGFDAVYFTGGSPVYLLERINETGFNESLAHFVEKGGVYVGVSAGAIVGAANLPNNLGYLNATLNVHMQDGMADGVFDNQATAHINLKNDKAILICGDTYQII
jgi:peptidase E